MATRKKAALGRDIKSYTRDDLAKILHYDPETGAFTRKTTGYAPLDARLAGKPAGTLNGRGYVVISVFERPVRAHRLAWLCMTGEWPDEDIDHINGNRADNRWCNLRAASRWQNIHNMGMRARNTSGLKGASYDTRRDNWRSQITVNGKHHFLGRYSTAQEAAEVYAEAARRMVGEFARVA